MWRYCHSCLFPSITAHLEKVKTETASFVPPEGPEPLRGETDAWALAQSTVREGRPDRRRRGNQLAKEEGMVCVWAFRKRERRLEAPGTKKCGQVEEQGRGERRRRWRSKADAARLPSPPVGRLRQRDQELQQFRETLPQI